MVISLNERWHSFSFEEFVEIGSVRAIVLVAQDRAEVDRSRAAPRRLPIPTESPAAYDFLRSGIGWRLARALMRSAVALARAWFAASMS